ncbi:MAG: hypothetical protein ACRDHP_06270 [Ktedonobacterales bacterium]
MASPTYEEVLSSASQLTTDDQLKLLAELVTRMRENTKPNPPHSILELEGLGKEAWEGIDAQEYVNQERDSWGG